MALIPAAQYLRMSTDHQQYSLQNQADAIAQYAVEHGFTVTETYQDAGRTGVVIKNRVGLSQLIQDVVSGKATYSVILVYDVSRWGRFQNSDEAAHYEFLCTSAGIPIHYCAEPFENDGQIPGMIMKALKRTMAGEFSRDLGDRVYAGQKRLVQLGFKMGGFPGYGLRRLLVGADGRPKQVLKEGEYKSISTDRVILVPGPAEEVAVVQRIFRAVIDDRKRPGRIALELNREQVPFLHGQPWNRYAIYGILTRQKYAGFNTWSRTSLRLSSPRRVNPIEQRVVVPGCFEPIVSPESFRRANEVLRERSINKTNEEILERLRELLKAEGHLSQHTIDRSGILPAASTIQRRFGTLQNAYELVGYKFGRRFFGRCFRRARRYELRADLERKIKAIFPDVKFVKRYRGRRALISFSKDLSVSLILCPHRETDHRRNSRWVLNVITGEEHRITLLCLLNKSNDHVASMYLMPGIDKVGRYRILPRDRWLRKGLRVSSLAQLLEFARKLQWEMNSMPCFDLRDWHETSRYFHFLDDPTGT